MPELFASLFLATMVLTMQDNSAPFEGFHLSVPISYWEIMENVSISLGLLQ